MKCINCKEEIGNPKKYQVVECKCGAKLMLIEIKKTKQLTDLSENKGD